MSERLWPTITAFYAARGGAASGESDLGVHWSIGRVRGIRVSTVHETGDVYAISPSGMVGLLGNIDADRTGPHHVPAHCGENCVYAIAERLFHGWADAIHRPNSLHWVRDRVGGVSLSHLSPPALR